ncbi:MAG: hypothetical protein DWH98_04550 [Planctomycetota bacterium]|nr:MAG: hypothetical protein DWH98_04550 [Planctomycetota bacterium]
MGVDWSSGKPRRWQPAVLGSGSDGSAGKHQAQPESQSLAAERLADQMHAKIFTRVMKNNRWGKGG